MIIYGKQIFWYLVKNHPSYFEEVYLADDLKKDEFKLVSKLNVQIVRIDERKAQAMARGGAHQGLIAKVKEPKIYKLKDIEEPNFGVVLVGLTDMGNIGQIIRTSYALGVDFLIVSGLKQFSLEKAAKSSSGAIFDLKIVEYQNPLDAINELKLAGFETIVADANGNCNKNLTFKQKKALILGSEHDGVPQKVQEKCDIKIGINMQNGFDSLNVSAAAAILIDRIRE